jgi:AcrR family transcriptional regulator
VPDAYPGERIEASITDVLHRTLFGMRADVNVHPSDGSRSPVLEFGPAMLDVLRLDGAIAPDPAANPALDSLLASARGVFVEHGYHATRVDDLVEAAGVSHGAFYRYFRNKEHLARILTARAVQTVGAEVLELPEVAVLEGPTGTTVLRRWLRRYYAAHAHEARMLRVWVDAALEDPVIRTESAPLLDWGRRRMSRFLEPRGFGNADLDAVVMVALLGVFGARQQPSAEVEAAAHIIERGLLGR